MTIKEIKQFVRANIAVFLLLFTLVFTVYFNSFFNDFVSADDLEGYVNNANLLNPAYQLQNASPFLLIWAFFKLTAGNQPFFIHFYSVTLHFISVCLVYTFVRLVFDKKTALFSSLIFAVLPTISEAVLWISGHGYIHLGIIALISLNLYALYKKTHNKKFLIWTYIFFTLSVFIYRFAWTLIIPFLTAVLEIFIYNKKLNKHSAVVLTPLFAIGLISFLVIFVALQEQRLYLLENQYHSFDAGSTPWLNRLPYSFFMLFKLLIIPDKLALFHEGNVIPQSTYILMIAVLFLFGPFILIIRKKHRVETGLMLAIVCSVLPIFSPVQIAFFIAERYLYVSGIFYSILLTTLMLKADRTFKWKQGPALLLVCLLLVFSVRTVIRSNDWRSSRTLWESNAKLSPNSARIFNNLGDAYAVENRFEESINSFKRAVEINPQYVEAIHNLGNTYLQTGNYTLAKEQFEKALSLNPNYAGAERAKKVIEVLTSQPSEVSQ